MAFGIKFQRVFGAGTAEVLRLLQDSLERTFGSFPDLDGPHYVGGTGEPGFENNWVNFNVSTQTPCGFWKDPSGFVHLQGTAKSGTVGGTGVVWTLPNGYRPALDVSFAVESNNAHGRCIIRSTGLVVAEVGSNAWFCFDGISFKAAD